MSPSMNPMIDFRSERLRQRMLLSADRIAIDISGVGRVRSQFLEFGDDF